MTATGLPGDERDAAFRLAFLMTGNAERAAAVAAAALGRLRAAGGPRARRRLQRALVREVLGPWYRRIFLRDQPAWPPPTGGGPVDVWPAVLRLSPLARTVLVLSVVEGLPAAGVAALLGARPDAVERVLAGALAAAGADAARARAALADVAAALEAPSGSGGPAPARTRPEGRGGPTRRLVLGGAVVVALALIASGVASLRGGDDGGDAAPAATRARPATTAATTPGSPATTATTVAAGPWQALAGVPVAADAGAAAAWTGRSFVVWGAGGAAAYDPAAGSWQPVPGVPGAPDGARAVWTGRQVVAVGPPGRAVALDPEAGTWGELAGPPAEVLARPAVVWTGSVVLVWGGPGLAFDPGRGSWARLPASGLDPRPGPVGAWTGERMLVWGGEGFADGAAYDPARRRWDRLPPAPLASGTGAVGAWDGRVLVVATPGGAAAYDPGADRWEALPAPPFAPVAAAAVHGDVVLVGAGGEAAVLVRGLAGATWSALAPAPGPFGEHPAVAAGDALFVAGRTVAVLRPQP